MSTGIEWTDETWNPLVGCQWVSPGCDGCYAAREAFGRLSSVPVYAGLAHRRTPDELPRFTGEVRTLPERLDQPLRWRKPRRVFVNSMSDLFHPAVTNEFIADVFAVMARAEQHTFQVLTKRPKRMAALTRNHGWVDRVCCSAYGERHGGQVRWPLPNVWLGTSVEDQAWADRRIPDLLTADAAVRFLSVEPLLGPVDLEPWLPIMGDDADRQWFHEPWVYPEEHPPLGWVIVGGESGPRARPMHPDWVRSIRDQCEAAGVPFLFKQWGEWCPAVDYHDGTHLIQVDGRYVDRASATMRDPYGTGSGPQDLVDRGHPGWVRIRRVGKKAAGRTLDGRVLDGYPAPRVAARAVRGEQEGGE